MPKHEVSSCSTACWAGNSLTQETVKAPRNAAETAVRLVVLAPDGEPENAIHQDTPPFKLCHGATHRLEVKATGGSTWIEQPLSLHFLSNEDAPSRYGLSATPQLVTATVDEEDAYQPLNATGVEWQLMAQITDTVASGEVMLGLGSWWQAPKYPIGAQVGDHWYGITDLAWDGTVPIVEGGKPVTFTVTVCSAFDVKRPIEGARVQWTAGAREFAAAETGADGQLTVEYTPSEADIEDGKVEITATCTDAFGHPTSSPLRLPAFVKAPWDELMTMVLREEDGTVVDPSVLGMRLTRGGKYKLTLTPASEDSYFVGHTIALDWFEGSLRRRANQLGIDFEPKGGHTMPKDGLTWDIFAGEESGQFTLKAWSETLGQDVPFLLPGVQMSANLADEADLTPAAQDEDGVPPIFQRGVGKPVRIVPKAGSPLADMALDATLKFVPLPDDIPATQIPAEPAYNAPNLVTATGALWTLLGSANGDSGQFSLQVEMPGFTAPLTLDKGLMMSSVLGDEAKVLIDGAPLGDASLFLWRNDDPWITLQPRADIKSPLGKTTLKGELLFKKGSLESDKVKAAPDYEEQHTIVDDLRWNLKGENVSGTFSLQIKVSGFEEPLEIPALLMSEDIRDEANITIDGKELSSTVIFFRSQEHELKVEPKAGSPLRARDFFKSSLTFMDGSLTADKVKAEPNYAEDYPLPAEGLPWTLKGENVSGTFTLKVNVSGFKTPVEIPVILLSGDLRDEADITVGNRSTNGTGATPPKREIQSIFWIGERRTVSIQLKAGSPLLLLNQKATLRFVEKDAHLKKGALLATPAYDEETPTLTDQVFTWSIDPSNDHGQFSLRVEVPIFSTQWEMETGSLMSRVLTDEARVEIGGLSLEDGKRVLYRGILYPIRLVPRAEINSPLAKTGLSGWITLEDSSLAPEKVKMVPGYGQHQGMRPDGLTWDLTGQDVSGTLGLAIHVNGFNSSIALPNILLLSQSIFDEVDFSLSGVKNGRHLYRYYAYSVSVSPKVGGVLERLAFQCWINYSSDMGKSTEHIMWSNPEFLSKHSLTSEGLKWGLMCFNSSDRGHLKLFMDVYPQGESKERLYIVATHLENEITALIDGEPFNSANNIFLGTRPRVITLKPKEGSPYGGSDVGDDNRMKLVLRFDEGQEWPEEVMLVQPASDPPIHEHAYSARWEVSGKHGLYTAKFNLKLVEKDSVTFIVTPECTLIPNPDSAS